MKKISFISNSESNYRYQERLFLEIQKNCKKGIINNSETNQFSYIANHTTIRKDPVGYIVDEYIQDIQELDHNWFYDLSEYQKKVLCYYYKNIDDILTIKNYKNAYILSTEMPKSNDILHYLFNENLEHVFIDDLEIMYTSIQIDSFIRYRRGGDVVTDHSQHLSKCYTVDEPVVFIGTRPNYGHWLVDFYPLFIIAHQNPKLNQLKVVTCELTKPQVELLEIIGFDLDRIIQIPTKELNLCSGHYKNVYTFNRVNPVFGSDLTRSFIPPSNHSSNKYVYLSRDRLQHSRVSNSETLNQYLESKKFNICHAHELSIPELISVLSNSNVVLSTVGAQLSNVLFSQKCTVIILMPSLPVLDENSLFEFLYHQSLTYYLPCLKSVKLIHFEINEPAEARNNLDCEILVESDLIENVLTEVDAYNRL